MHVLRRLRRTNEANLPELRRRIAAAAETAGAARFRVIFLSIRGVLSDHDS
jgi:hypothetical protein